MPPPPETTPQPVRVDDELLTSDELAAMLKVSIQTVRSWRTRRVGPEAVKAGHHVRYRRSAIEAWLAEQGR